MSRISDAVTLGVGPSAKGFMKRAEAQIKAQKSNGIEINVNPNTKRASVEMAAWRKAQERHSLNLRVDIDKSSLKRAQQTLHRYEHTYTRSPLSKAIRINVMVAGAAALPALTKAALSTAAALTELSRAALVLPGVFSGIAAGIGTLLTGMRGVGAAFSAASTSMDDAAQNARDYQKATRDLERAQRDTVKALKEANRQIQDQKDKLSQNQISAEQARLNVMKANKALAEGADNWLDQQQLILDQKQAYLDFNEVLKQSRRDIQDYYDDATKGATQSDTWKDALDRLSDAVANFTKAQDNAGGKADEFVKAMAKLSPAAQDFVTKVQALKGAWNDLQGAVQDNLFAGLGDAITDLANRRLPQLKRGMSDVARGLNTDFKQAIESIGNDKNSGRISAIFDRTARAMNMAKPGIDAFVSAIAHLSEAGSRFLPRLATAFNTIGQRFDSFLDRADKDGSLDRWISRGLDAFSSLGRSIGSIMNIFGSLTSAYEKATGKVGGFITTMEGGLAKLADYLGSSAGQQALVRWINEAQDFLKMVKDALPGIVDVFQSIGEAARTYASFFYPLISGVGRFLQNHAELVKGVLAAYLGWKTIKPIIDHMTHAYRGLVAGFDAYRAKLAEVVQVEKDAARAASEAVAKRNALAGDAVDARKRARAANAEVALANQSVESAKRHLDVESDMQVLREKAAVTEARVQEARRKYWGANADHPERLAAESAHYANLQRITAAEEARERQVINYNNAIDRQTAAMAKAKTANAEAQTSYASLRGAMRDADGACRNLNETVNRSTAGGGVFGKLRTAIGSRGGGGAAGALGALAGAFGFVVSAVGSVAAGAGIMYALDQLTQAHDRATSAAQNQKAAEEALSSSLQAGTGAASNATLQQNLELLRKYANPVHPDDRGQDFNAADILQQQLGVAPGDLAKLTLPTQVAQREERIGKPADSKIIAAVPNLEEWKRWGEQYKKNGVDATVYGKALNGDQDSIAKVEAARHAIADGAYRGPGGFGAAVGLHLAPNDLGHAQEQLDRSGPGGGLRGLSLATGAARNVGNTAVQQGQNQQALAQAIPQPGLNTLGNRTFNPFGVAPGGVAMQPDGSANIALDRFPDDSVPGWVEGMRDRGVSVERRAPGGANLHLSPAAVQRYFNPQGAYARGGHVWGSGTATSDSIPAMLSNGEFVVNARAAQQVGPGLLHAINSGNFPRFGDGGPVIPSLLDRKPLAGGSVGAAGNSAGKVNSYLPNIPATQGPFAQAQRRGAGPVGDTPRTGWVGRVGDWFNRNSVIVARKTPDAPKPAPPPPLPPVPGKPALPAFMDYLGIKPKPISAPVAPVPPGHSPIPWVTTGPVNLGPSPAPISVGNTQTGKGVSLGPGGVPSQPGMSPQGFFDVGSTGTSGGVPTYEQLGPIAAAIPGGPGRFSEAGLQVNTIGILRQLETLYPDLPNIGGYREDPAFPDEHPAGKALDAMINSPGEGYSIKDWALTQPGVDYAIWDNKMWYPDGSSKPYTGGNPHTDHVHIHTSGGGYPADGAAIPGPTPGIGTPMVNGVPQIPGINAPIQGPFGPIPFQANDFLGSIGRIILGAIGSFFGIDLSGIFSFVDQISGGLKDVRLPGISQDAGLPGLPDPNIDPGPDQNIVNQLVDQARQAKADGNEALSRSLLDQAKQYANRPTGGTAPAVTRDSSQADIAKYIYNTALSKGYSPTEARYITAQASGESSFKPAISGGVQGDDEVIGIFQEKTAFSGGLTVEQRKDPMLNIAAYFAQLEKNRGGPGDIVDWLAVTSGGGPAHPNNGGRPYIDALSRQLVNYLGFSEGGPAILPGQPVQPPTDWQRTLAHYGLIKTGTPHGPGNFNPNVRLDTSRVSVGPRQTEGWRDRFRMNNGLGNLLGANGYDGGLTPNYPFDALPWDMNWNNPSDVIKHTIGHARGGHISGPGTSTSDSIPAMLSDGEFVMRASAVSKYGKGFMQALNTGKIPHAAEGGWFGSGGQSKGQLPLKSWSWLGKQPEQPKQSGLGNSALAGAQETVQSMSASSPIQDGGGGFSFEAQDSGKKERGILAAGPQTRDHNLKALSTGIQAGAANIGSWINTGVGLAAGAAGGAGVPGAGTAASLAAPFIQGATQLSGNFLDNLVNVVSSGLVGNATTSQTGQGYGAPLNAQPATVASRGGVTNVHNGNIVTNNLDQYTATQKRMEAQRSLPFLNRI